MHLHSTTTRPRGLTLPQQIEWELSHGIESGECLISHRSTNASSSGYAKAWLGGRVKRVHRVVLEHKLGRSLTPQEEARHTCHRRNCINPQHLIPGTHVDNMKDMVIAGRGRSGQRSGEHNSSAKLTNEQVKQIRDTYSVGGFSQMELGRRFGVSGATINRIVNRRNYK